MISSFVEPPRKFSQFYYFGGEQNEGGVFKCG